MPSVKRDDVNDANKPSRETFYDKKNGHSRGKPHGVHVTKTDDDPGSIDDEPKDENDETPPDPEELER